MQYDVDRIPLMQGALEAVVGERVRGGTVPSSIAVIVQDGRILASAAAADEAVCRTPTLDTAFRVASCTKSFTAARMLQLRDAGRLDLDAPVDDVLPLRCVPHARPTIRQLATMSAGFPTDDPWADRQESMPAAVLDALAAEGLRTSLPPGAGFQYSNLGYALLGRVLERIDGRPYIRQVHEELLDPLGLSGVGFDRSVAAPDGVATGYAKGPDGWEAQPSSAPGAFSPIGGVVATPRALAGWLSWLAAADGPDADDAVLSAASRREMAAGEVVVDADDAYGFGLVASRRAAPGGCRGRRFVSHSGGYPGFGAHLRWHVGSRIGVVLLENARYSRAATPASALLERVLDAVAVPDAVPDVWPETLAAWERVEALLRRWDDAAATALFADNVDQDLARERRRAAVAELTAAIALDPAAPVLPLLEAAPDSDGAAHLSWVVPGASGVLRCTIRLTPEPRPRVQTLDVRRA